MTETLVTSDRTNILYSCFIYVYFFICGLRVNVKVERRTNRKQTQADGLVRSGFFLFFDLNNTYRVVRNAYGTFLRYTRNARNINYNNNDNKKREEKNHPRGSPTRGHAL